MARNALETPSHSYKHLVSEWFSEVYKHPRIKYAAVRLLLLSEKFNASGGFFFFFLGSMFNVDFNSLLWYLLSDDSESVLNSNHILGNQCNFFRLTKMFIESGPMV